MLPTEKDIQLPLLKEIAKRGGEAKRSEKRLYQDVARHFPQITPNDLAEMNRPGDNKWEKRVKFAMTHLTQKGEIEIPQKGVLRIMQKGWQRLGQSPSGTTPLVVAIPPRAPLPDEPATLAEQIKGSVDKLVGLAQKTKPTPVLTHDELIKMGREIGEKLGKIVETESGPVFRHDVSWKDSPYRNPCLVIEICDKGVLDKDLQSLSWASHPQNWGAKGILVIVDDKDYESALRKLAPGTSIYLMKAADFQKLYSIVISAGKEILRSIFGT